MPHNPTPLVSVIVPTYNAVDWLPQAIASIESQEGYSHEILLIDDGSTDATKVHARHWKVRYAYQPNQGPAAARNLGIRLTRGRLLAFLDDDDLWTSDHLQQLAPPLLANPELAFVTGSSRLVTVSSPADPLDCLADYKPDAANSRGFLVSSGVYRRSAFEQAGLFEPSMRRGEDLDWIAAARHANVPHQTLPTTVLIRRLRPGSLTYGQDFQQANLASMLRRDIARRRGQAPKLELGPAPTGEERPAISVIVPTFNTSSYLPAAIESIRRQDWGPLEIIVVDDGSTEPLPLSVTEADDIRIVRQSNQGAAAARNAGIAAARHELLAFLDSDDLWTRDHLHTLVAPLMAAPELDFTWGPYQVTRMPDDPHDQADTVLEEESKLFAIHSGVYRRSAFEKAGMFDSQVRTGEDTLWYKSAHTKGLTYLRVESSVLIHRRRPGSLTYGRDQPRKNLMELLQRNMKLRRETPAA